MITGLVGRIRHVPPTAQDAGLAAAVVLADLKVFSADLVLGLPVVAYAAVGGLILVWRRRAPFLVFVLVWLHALVGLLSFPGYSPLVGLLLALYTVAAHCSTKAAHVALALALVSTVVYAAHESFYARQLGARDQVPVQHGFNAFLAFLVLYGLLVGPVWAAGRWIQDRRLRMETRAAVAAERARIARELHDIVAHSVTVMMLQAAIAKRLADANPVQAAHALAAIDDQGRQAMSELRRMLVVLRADNAGDETTFETEPQRGLAQLSGLVDRVSLAGVMVDLEAVGRPPQLDPSVDLAAYRVVQEALTNTTRHAGVGAHAVVRWRWSGDGDVVVQVSDNGKGRPDQATRGLSTGHGLLGLRERVAVVGGRLEAGPTSDGGFEVTATLPVVGRPAESPLTR